MKILDDIFESAGVGSKMRTVLEIYIFVGLLFVCFCQLMFIFKFFMQ